MLSVHDIKIILQRDNFEKENPASHKRMIDFLIGSGMINLWRSKRIREENNVKEKLPTKTSEKIRFILSVLVFLAFVPLTIWGIPKVMALSDPVARENLQQYFASKGIGGWLIFLVVQILQVVVAMIPGEPIEICAGLLYGPVWGTLSCMLGILIGSLIVYALVKKLGMPIVSVFIDPDRLQNLWFVRDESRFEKIAFLLFFIPGTPKDLLTWAAGLLKINPLRFFLFSTIARLPSILTSTLAGASLITGDFVTMVLIFGITGCISIIGIYLHKKISQKK